MNHDLGVIFLTYNRQEYAERTIRSLFKNMYIGDYRIHFHIADDGSPDGYREALAALVQEELATTGRTDNKVTISNSQQGGYGHSYNLATQVVHPEVSLVLPLEDDWELNRSFNLPGWGGILENDKRVNCIRFGYLGYTQELRGSIISTSGHSLLLLDPDSPERHVCAGHPRLEKVSWAKAVGPWTEGLNPGAVEHDWCGRRAARNGVAWPIEYGMFGPWSHIGTLQARGDQT